MYENWKKLLPGILNIGYGVTGGGNIKEILKMTETAIVILNWNGIEFLKMFLGIVVNHSNLPRTKIIVADNNSSDGSAEWVENKFNSVEVIRLDRNYGFAGGYKIALQKIEARFFVLLNSDIEVTEGWLEPLVKYMDQNSDVAACQPKILSYSNKDSFEYAGAAGGFIDKYGYPFCRGRVMDFIERDIGQYDNYSDIFWASGACMIVRADAYLRCFGFDEDFFAHMEEIDLCWRFKSAGYHVSFVPDSVVYHVGGGTLPYNSQKKIYLNFRNNLYLLYKNLPSEKLHSTLFIRKVLDGISACIFLITGKFRNFMAVFKAHRDYYREINILRKKREIVQNISSSQAPNLILNKSIVFEFYVRGKKTYSKLIKN
jgi:GT2 family glycosyltransferase